MEQLLDAQPTIQSLPTVDGAGLESWKRVRAFSAVKMCACCGNEFRPLAKTLKGELRVVKEHLWEKQNYCSISCSKLHRNCTAQPGIREKLSISMKAAGHMPRQRMGNGSGLTYPQQQLLNVLGNGWVAEHPVETGLPRSSGMPRVLKLDLANAELKMGIEVNGSSHRMTDRRVQDIKKIAFLVERGWSVFSVTNSQALKLSTTCKSTDTTLTSLMQLWSTTVI